MGNYVFDTETLIDVVTPPARHQLHRPRRRRDPGAHRAGVARVYDFSKNVIPGQDERERGYWRDVGTLDAFYDANMDLIAPVPMFNLYNERVAGVHLPRRCRRRRCHGCGRRAGVRRRQPAVPGVDRLGRHVERSIIGPGVFVDHDAHVTDSIIFPGVHVGAGAQLHRCIIDKNVIVPPGYTSASTPVADAERFTISDRGIVVIEKDRLLT